VLHVQHLRWYPHIRTWHRRIECLIKHTDYTEYVGEDLATLPRHQWNRGRRWAALHERKREDHLGFRHPRVLVDVGMAMAARGRRRIRRRHGARPRSCARRRLGFQRRSRCGGLGLGLKLGQPLGRPLSPFYRWPRFLGRQRPRPQVCTSSGRFPAKKTY
jgi:hypothetical protein